MARQLRILLFPIMLLFTGNILADEKIQLDTTVIKGNTELPQIIYIVPWRDMKQEKRKEQTLILYSLYGDLFEPVSPVGDVDQSK